MSFKGTCADNFCLPCSKQSDLQSHTGLCEGLPGSAGFSHSKHEIYYGIDGIYVLMRQRFNRRPENEW